MVAKEIRNDVAEFFNFLVEKCLARDAYESGKIRVVAEDRWVLTNIAEVLSSEGIICTVKDSELGVCELQVHT